ncbi:uncharacterized mitochondrial protein AtMg00310-like [Coffea arabica]|uniref:Uncharacterized mitochondrial protein AtMg00310-like n=1 Tax=Coffea arabica TaxID=13443 RepID=A0A6P6SAR1_COFAR|nr:uncharacterized protein LOC113689242 [Coffea arabica]
MVIDRSKNSVLRFIKEKMCKKLQSWTGKMLSSAGKEVLLKYVALALSSYAMSIFKLPAGLCKELCQMMAKLWWGSDSGEKKMHWKSWANISNVKGKGRLGFRDVQCFNTSLLARQVWRMLTNPNLLVIKVVKGRYFPKSSILDAQVKNGASWIWQSLHSSIGMLNSGLRKQVGDGTTIAI